MITQLIYVQRVHGALGISCPCHPGLSLGAEITFQKGPPGWCGSFVPGARASGLQRPLLHQGHRWSQAWHVLGRAVVRPWAQPAWDAAGSQPWEGQNLRVAAGVSLLSGEGQIWPCEQGWSTAPSKGLGAVWPGVNALPSSPESPAGDARASPTRHSRTRCKTSRDEVTNKMPLAGRAEGTCHQLDTHMCLPGAVSLPHQLPCPGRRGSLGTRHRSFHPATPGTAVPGKMGAAAFKQSSCLFLKQLETAVRSWTHYWAQNNYDKNKFQMGSKGVVFVFTELEWISCLQVPLVFMDRKHELHTIIYYKQKRWLLQQPIYLCSCAFLRFMCCLTHGES